MKRILAVTGIGLLAYIAATTAVTLTIIRVSAAIDEAIENINFDTEEDE